MKILITHPFSWPYVRRGAERFLNELSRYLVSRGHEVTILTSKPDGNEEIAVEDGCTIVRRPQLQSRFWRWIRVGPEQTFLLTCLPFLRRHQFDAIHCLYFSDGCAARLASFFGRRPFVLQINGIPVARHFRWHPLDNVLLRSALAGASHVVTLSDVAERNLEKEFGRKSVLISPPCDVTQFRLKIGRDLERPMIFAVGAFGEPRKGGRVLVQAFQALKQKAPGAILKFSGDIPESRQSELLALIETEWRQDVEFLGRGKVEDLPDLYGEAAITVLPSLFDSFGMVLLESLACGTPVVGSRHGGIPDIVEEGVGVLFDPGSTETEPDNVAGLTDALLDALALYEDAGLPCRCRKRAEEFDWAVLGPRYEELYRDISGSS
jgi:phosphatidylinositol alpha-mannosyltransferase